MKKKHTHSESLITGKHKIEISKRSEQKMWHNTHYFFFLSCSTRFMKVFKCYLEYLSDIIKPIESSFILCQKKYSRIIFFSMLIGSLDRIWEAPLIDSWDSPKKSKIRWQWGCSDLAYYILIGTDNYGIVNGWNMRPIVIQQTWKKRFQNEQLSRNIGETT